MPKTKSETPVPAVEEALEGTVTAPKKQHITEGILVPRAEYDGYRALVDAVAPLAAMLGDRNNQGLSARSGVVQAIVAAYRAMSS